MISNIYFIMHIKTFLRKLNEASSNQTINPFIFGNKSRLKNSFQTINPARSSSQTKKFSLAKQKQNDSTIKYIQNRSPNLKSRLLKHAEQISSPQYKSQKYRCILEQRLADLFNQRKDLVIIRSKSRTESRYEQHYSSQKDLKVKGSEKQIPEYAKNIMKPCRITTVNFAKRDNQKTINSQPKVYCKSLLPNHKKSMKKIKTTVWETQKEHQLSNNKRKTEHDIKLNGWNDSRVDQDINYLEL